jgi:energy-coupling factor transport system ATP-binding protein
MVEGQIALEETPRELFRQGERLRELQLDVPPVTELAHRIHTHFSSFPPDLLTVDEVVDAIRNLHGTATVPVSPPLSVAPVETPVSDPAAIEPIVILEHLVHDYMRGTPLEVRALHDVSMTVYPGEIVGILGHTGSGKSTVIQHINGLLRPHSGRVVVFGQDLADPNVDVRAVRRQVGLVFQFPEAQIFERYVGDDIAFGPRNLGLDRAEVRARVQRAMEAVGLGFEEFKDRHTSSLSGGERRRVALAGVLALEPRILVLDEPTAGLDPAARAQLHEHILALHRNGVSLVMISHNMEELAAMCQRLVVLAEGRTVMEGPPSAIFAESARLRELGLDVPAPTTVVEELSKVGLLTNTPTVYTVEQAATLLTQMLKTQA